MSNRSLLIFRLAEISYPGAYLWRAAINSDVDGDTVWVERDSGCRNTDLIELRLTGKKWRGFDADERFTVGGKIITAEVRRLIPEWAVVLIETQPDTEKFGRWLSPIFVPTSSLDPLDTQLPGTTFERNEKGFLDLAAFLVAKFPEYCRWKEYR